jgi:hypothetical protein
MGRTDLQFPIVYIMDETYFICIACLVRHEYLMNPGKYSPEQSLLSFVSDMEKWGWASGAQTPVNMYHYCGKSDAGAAFLRCLCEIRKSLERFDALLPEEFGLAVFGEKAPAYIRSCPVPKILHWLAQICRLITDYNNLENIRLLPYPPR